MTIAASRLISDVKGQFEGGSSLTGTSWDTLLRMAADTMLENVTPETLKRTLPVYGGIAGELYQYYCPSEIDVPAEIYLNDGQRKFSYVPAKVYFADPRLVYDRFTFKYHNGVRFLYVRHGDSQSLATLETFESITGFSGTATPVLDSRNFVEGSGSVRSVFDDSGKYLEKTFSSAQDLSAYLQGITLLPAYMVNADQLASLEIRLMTDDSNYYSVNTTADSIPLDNIVELWNLIRFSMENAEETGAPNSENITKFRIYATANAGQTVTINLDRMSIQKAPPLYLEGYENKIFIDATTGVAKDTVDSTNDSMNIGKDEYGILLYETCLLVKGAGTKRQQEFTNQLARKYQAYRDSHTSEEATEQYNISPDISLETPIEGFSEGDDWGRGRSFLNENE